MLGIVGRLIRRFRRDERGAVLILFVLVVLPLLMIVAVVIDFSQSLVVKRQLTAAVDSAALALGTLPQITEPDALKAKADEYILAHYSAADIGTLTGSTAVRDGEEVIVTASAVVPTAFLGLAGVDSLTVNVTSTVVRKENKLEVVMVLDNSGSMAGNKLVALKSAAEELVTILFGNTTDPSKVKIGLVPFEGGVNVGVPYDKTDWLDVKNPAPLNRQQLNVDLAKKQSAFTVLESMRGGVASNWRGCVRSRYNAGVDDLDTTDAEPDATKPETLFSAYFQGYLGTDIKRYENQTSQSQNQNCAVAPIRALTSQQQEITDAIKAMRASASTNIPEGLAWGWRLISHAKPFTEGVAYTAQDTIKAIIVLTDGENNADTFSSYGKREAANPQIGNVNVTSLDNRLKKLCTNIKANHDAVAEDEDILIFAITFNVNSTGIRTLMETCASPGKYFNSPNAEDLRGAFASIAASLNQLRIKK